MSIRMKVLEAELRRLEEQVEANLVQLRSTACEREGALAAVNLTEARIRGDELELTFRFRPLNDIPVKHVEFLCSRSCEIDDFQEASDRYLCFDVRLPADIDPIRAVAQLYNGQSYELCLILPDYYRDLAAYVDAHQAVASEIPTPPGDVVFVTMGHPDGALYETSVLAGGFHFREILRASGQDPGAFTSILDFGCGTGRILKSWYVDDPRRELSGVDYNHSLIEWNQQHFPDSIHFSINQLKPPLDFEDDQFDLIYLVSVFTHLSFENQLAWLREFERILRPGASLVITLHGLNFLDQIRRDDPPTFDSWVASRYWEQGLEAEGANACATLTMPDFAYRSLFPAWEVLGYFPGGRIGNHVASVHFAHLQDVYVLRKR
jgi:SAM-dependent methyltransferase